MDAKLLLQLVRELRSCSGVEKTPEQVERIMNGAFSRPASAARKLLNNADRMQKFAKKVELQGVDGFPTTDQIIAG